MRSRPRKPAWPSLVWNTCASIAERVEGPHPADAEEDLLAQAVLGVAAVEAVGDRADVGRVLVDVGVEQVERDAADLGLPDPGDEGLAGQVDLDPHVLARREGHRVRVEVGVALLLPAVDRQRLAEVAVPVEEADADEGHAEVAGRLEVVAGEHAEAARVLREGLGDAELGGEVGHRAQRGAVAGLEPAVARRRSAASSASHLAEEAHEGRRRRPARRAARAARGPSRRTGSWTVASQASGSTQRNRSRVWASQDQRRFMASSSSAASSGGMDGRTVKLRRAFIAATLPSRPPWELGERVPRNALFTPRVPSPWVEVAIGEASDGPAGARGGGEGRQGARSSS